MIYKALQRNLQIEQHVVKPFDPKGLAVRTLYWIPRLH